MLLSFVALAIWAADPDLPPAPTPRIQGVVSNGTQHGKPVAGIEVILRAGRESALQPVAQTMTDGDGRFVFGNLPVEPGLIFLPGANHQGVHYPGQRIRALETAPVNLVVYDAVASPNPLVAESRAIDVKIQKGVLEITETLVVSNPSLTTYVGKTDHGTTPTTLALSIPDGFERVTFHKEFFGRRFKLVDKHLETDIPWTLGKRELAFTYHLPFEESKRSLAWSADLPCSRVRISVHGENADQFECNLPRAATPGQTSVIFESAGQPIPAGQVIGLHPCSLPLPWITYLRWSALGLLVCLILATAVYRIRWRDSAKRVPATATRTTPRKAA